MEKLWEGVPSFASWCLGQAIDGGGPWAVLAIVSSLVAGTALKLAAVVWAGWKVLRGTWWLATWCAARTWGGFCGLWPKPEPQPMPAPLSDLLVAMLDEIATGTATEGKRDGYECLIVGVLEVRPGNGHFWLEGKEATADLTAEELAILAKAATDRLDAHRAAEREKRRKEIAAKVQHNGHPKVNTDTPPPIIATSGALGQQPRWAECKQPAHQKRGAV